MGSQLKKLRYELKSQGLIGQTNGKKRSRDSRDKQQEKIHEIRTKFNVFDNKVNRVKRDVTTIANGKFITVGSDTLNGTSKSNSFLEKNLQLAYDAHKRRKGKNGRIMDRRFGEGTELSQEEKMLQRFIREREGSKRLKFSLESDDDNDNDDDDEPDFELTHSGKSLALTPSEDENDIITENTVNKKKTKKEVMQEIIAKSKFYKQQRQRLFDETQTQIEQLDGTFQDIMGEMSSQKVDIAPKSQQDMEYDAKVRELVYDKRSVPAGRTKTDEEIKAEYEVRMNKLDQDRLNRMEGERESQADDLGFFENDDEDEENDGADEENDGDDIEQEEIELNAEIDLDLVENKVDYINKFIKTYKPHLRQGNKTIMNQFVATVFKFIVNYSGDEFNEIIRVLKTISESYNETLVAEIRNHMQLVQSRIASQSLLKSDFVYFTLCGYLFSTSDKYHLIIIPNLILMHEILITFRDPKLLGQVVFIIDAILQYQRISKRFSPEINYSLIKALQAFNDEYHETDDTITLGDIVGGITPEIENKLVNKTLDIIDNLVTTYKDYTIFSVISKDVLQILDKIKFTGHKLDNVMTKLRKVHDNIEVVPLQLQAHRQLAIKTYEPKFEENFNPTKIYDNLEQAEVNKIKKQFKKEKKMTIKDLRKQNKFEGNQQISEKIKMYDDYHKKMANIVNSISTVEGHERNQYEREKRKQNQKQL